MISASLWPNPASDLSALYLAKKPRTAYELCKKGSFRVIDKRTKTSKRYGKSFQCTPNLLLLRPDICLGTSVTTPNDHAKKTRLGWDLRSGEVSWHF